MCHGVVQDIGDPHFMALLWRKKEEFAIRGPNSDAEMQIIQDPKVLHKVAGVRLRSKNYVAGTTQGPMALFKFLVTPSSEIS